MAITVFLSHSRGLLNWEPGGPASLRRGPHSSIFSPTDLISNWLTSWLHPGYIIVRRPPSSCGHHKLHSFNLSTVKVISWYSSTGCTCYLHRCISYFDSLAGVNIFQSEEESQRRLQCIHKGEIWIFSKLLLLHFAFMRLVQGHLKALNHLHFSLLLNFHESNTEPSQGTELSLLTSRLLWVSYSSGFSLLNSLAQGQCSEENNI